MKTCDLDAPGDPLMVRTRAFVGVALVSLLAGAAPPAGSWRYVVPPAGDAFSHPPLRAIALSSERPAGLKESVRYRGARQRYARLVYGSGRTAPVDVVVDEVGPNE